MANNNKVSNIVMENAKIIFRNFSGREERGPQGQIFNEEGKRNFTLIIEDMDFARTLANDGWNIKFKEPREEGDEPYATLKVNVSYKVKAPNIQVVSKKRTRLTEENVDLVDGLDIANVDLVINPSYYDIAGRSGISAYLSSMYIVPMEDAFASKYEDIPDADAFDGEPF